MATVTPIPEDWQPLRDDSSKVVTITELQLRAIWRAISVVEAVRRHEGCRSMWENPITDLYKSRLLGRILLDGRLPLSEKPPLVDAGGAYWLVDPDLCPECGRPRDAAAPVTSWEVDGDRVFNMRYCSQAWHVGLAGDPVKLADLPRGV